MPPFSFYKDAAMKKNLLILFVLTALIAFNGCKKDDNPVAPGGGTNTGNNSGQPMPKFDTLSNYNGVLASIQYSMDLIPGIPTNIAMAFAQFGTTTTVSAGTVSLNSNDIPATTSGNTVFYMIPSTTNPTATLSNVNFNGSNHTWTVGGSSAVSAFTASVTSVSSFDLTYPTTTTTHSKANSLAVNWSGSNSNNKVMIVMAGTAGAGSYSTAELSDNGSYTIPSASLAGFSGAVMLQVVKYRYNVATAGGKSYVLMSEVIKQVTFNIN